MGGKKLGADEIGLPRFSVAPAAAAEVFDLESHRRAREALDFALSVTGIGFNVFVVGEDRSSRMTATMAYLEEAMGRRPPANDWIYLNNLHNPAAPTPHRLPRGVGRRFRDRIAETIVRLRAGLAAAFASEAFQARFRAIRDTAQQAMGEELERLRETARAHGLELVEGQDGSIKLVPGAGAPAAGRDPAAERDLAAGFARLQKRAIESRGAAAAQAESLQRAVVADVASPVLEEMQAEFSGFSGLARWLTEVRVDILESPGRFRAPDAERAASDTVEPPERRYAVNLLVDRSDEPHPAVVLESNPTYENLFGRIEYHQAQGSIETDFTLVRAGSLHRANGGILVLRGEALAANPASWYFLKAALRDREIRIEELPREHMPRIAGSPQPKPAPLEVKVVIVGAPRWYATFFNGDPDFSTYFKIKADIDDDMEASPHNLAVYAGLIAAMARARNLEGAEEGAVRRLLGVAARWAERRDRLTARIELIEDLVAESAIRAAQDRQPLLTEAAVQAANAARRRRNSRIEDRILRHILEGEMMIDTAGAAIGQVNALTVYDSGDRAFGTPIRVSARASVGSAGVVNIERDVALGGPIQQKGAMVLEGFLAGCFAQDRPLSFTCSITFEQNYGGVEGDSASLAELIAILSDLAQVPVRQNLAITGSVNQAGHAQAIGGALRKIEGFFRVCAAKPGGLAGAQGVIVPEANRHALVLRDEVADAITAGKFHIWSVASVGEAAELLLGIAPGERDAAGRYPPESLFGRVARRLAEFDRLLAARRGAG